MKQLKMLLAIKKVIELDDSDTYYIHTINRKTNWEGCASFFTNGEKKLRVYEGSGTGEDDHDVTYEEFVINYQFTLEVE